MAALCTRQTAAIKCINAARLLTSSVLLLAAIIHQPKQQLIAICVTNQRNFTKNLVVFQANARLPFVITARDRRIGTVNRYAGLPRTIQAANIGGRAGNRPAIACQTDVHASKINTFRRGMPAAGYRHAIVPPFDAQRPREHNECRHGPIGRRGVQRWPHFARGKQQASSVLIRPDYLRRVFYCLQRSSTSQNSSSSRFV